MPLLDPDQLVQFTFIEKIIETTTTTPPAGPPSTQTVGQPPNQQTFTMPGAPGIPETTVTSTEVQVIGFINVPQIASVTLHIDKDSGNPVPGRSDILLVDGTVKLVQSSPTSVVNAITT